MRQDQILEERNDEQQEEDLNMRNFLKDLKSQHQRVDQATAHVQQQDKRLVAVNEKLEDYNKEVSHGEELMDIVQKGPFQSLIDGIKGLFTRKKPDKLGDKEKEILNKAKNKKMDIDNYIDKEGEGEEEEKKETKKNIDVNNYEFKEDGDWEIIKDKNKNLVYADDEDEAIDESIKEVKGMINSVKYFNKNVNDSKEVVEITNKNFDKSLGNVSKMNKRMKNHK